MRGKRREHIQHNGCDGLIPAYAGKTSKFIFSHFKSRAHPRVCGENQVNVASTVVGVGSSPRMRGKLHVLPAPCKCQRLIPAYAGKTPLTARNPPTMRAHPRVCGENADGAITALSIGGSSPRMRGKPLETTSVEFHEGLIPAYAGKTFDRPRNARLNWAHPRVCGENIKGFANTASTSGSSPRMRGKHSGGFHSFAAPGLIPAYAGKTY